MRLTMIGISHNTAKLETRERFSMRAKLMKDVLSRAVNVYGSKGAVLLSTCNRMELYAETDDEHEAGLIRALSGYFSISPREIEDHFYQKRGADAVEHLFSV
ncbi:MAG: glutamyl-tRNA reductase, partial [Candidatus Omnitrophota bacterium]